MTPDELRTIFQAALAGGCGTAITFLYQLWLSNVTPTPSPLMNRLIVFGLCSVVPTIFYLMGVALGWWGYDLATNIADIVAAFTTSTLWHGFMALPNAQPAPPIDHA